MNDLQPWKIWAVTAALVCAILGITAARVRPLVIDEASAQAAVASSGEVSASIGTPSPDSTEFDAYLSYIPHRSYSHAGYAPVQASAILPTNSPLYGNGVSSALQTESYQEPVVDVTQELIGNQGSQADLITADNNQVTNYTYLSPLDVGDYYTNTADVPTDLPGFPPAPIDLAFNTTFDVASPDGNGIFVEDSSGTNDVRMYDFALQSAVYNTAINDPAVTNGTADVVVSLRSDDPILAARSLAIESEAESQAAGLAQNLAMSGELDEELGEQEVANGEKWQALRAEAMARAEEAQAQMQATMQLRDEAVYSASVGNIYLQINGSQYPVQPRD